MGIIGYLIFEIDNYIHFSASQEALKQAVLSFYACHYNYCTLYYIICCHHIVINTTIVVPISKCQRANEPLSIRIMVV